MSDTPKDAKGIFLAALEIADTAERAGLLERSCGGDAALRQRVDALLHAYGEPSGPLDKLAAALASTELGEPIREQVGTNIGPYKLMEQVGEGGFGLVFVAEQQRPIRRKVALKIIKPGMDTHDASPVSRPNGRRWRSWTTPTSPRCSTPARPTAAAPIS